MYFKMADVSLHLSLQHYTILPPLRKGEEDTKKTTNKHIKITYKSTGDYFEMADVSLHLSLQHYTMLPPLRKAEEDTVLR